MATDNIKSLETKVFKKRLIKLAAAPDVGDAEFADIVYEAVSKYGVTEEKFRDMFGLTAGAVERWTQRQNLPQPFARPKIVGWILDSISAPATSPPA